MYLIPIAKRLLKKETTGTSVHSKQGEPHVLHHGVRAIAVLCLLGTLGACASKPLKQVPTPSEQQHTEVPQMEAGLVRKSPKISVYKVGRQVDPQDPRLMHEAHLVYRIEEDGDWDLGPSQQAGERLTGSDSPTSPPSSKPNAGHE